MKTTFSAFSLALLSFFACKKSPQEHTKDMAGIHHFYGTQSGTYLVVNSSGHGATTHNYANTVSRIDTITVYSDRDIEVNGKDFTLVESNSTGKFLLFKDELHGNCSITYYYSKNTFKYEGDNGNSHIEMVSP